MITDHPNGFRKEVLELYPDGGSVRRHRWDAPFFRDSDIHQHRGDIIISRVEEGVLREDIWGYEDTPDGDHYRVQVDCYTDEEGGYRVDEMSPRVCCRVMILRTEIHQAGEAYHRPASDLHTITALEVPAVTRVRFGPTYQQVHMMIRRNLDEPAGTEDNHGS